MDERIQNISTFQINDIIMSYNAENWENCEIYEIIEIIISSNVVNRTFTLCPLLWSGNGWVRDVRYTDDISTWTMLEMLRLRDSWEYVN